MLGALAYYLTLPILYLLSWLPFWALYRVSDLLFFVLAYVVRYRRQVVLENLRNAFPDKTEKEVRAIARKFYRYLADLIVEVLKLITISPRSLRRRVTFPNLEIVEKLAREGQSFLLVLGHYGNWEMFALAESLRETIPFFGIYRPLKNKRVDRFIARVRTRFGMHLVTMKDTLRTLVRNRNRAIVMGFIADQSPPPDRAIWTTFLHQDTAFFTGPEKIARKFNYPLMYVWVKRPRRGYYVIEVEVTEENPSDTAEGALTHWHVRRLEKQIRDRPELWMWSHRRWKHQRPEGATSFEDPD